MPIDRQPDGATNRAAAARSQPGDDSGSGTRPPAGGAGRPAFTDERCDEIRRRVIAGTYSSRAVVDEVARRMLASGDLR